MKVPTLLTSHLEKCVVIIQQFMVSIKHYCSINHEISDDQNGTNDFFLPR